MSEVQIPANWSTGHFLAYIYLNFCVHSDGEIDASELEVLVTKLGEWPFVDNAGVILAETTQFWGERGSLEEQVDLFVAFLGMIRDQTDEDFRRAVLGDLAHLAMADDVVKEGEANWLAIVEQHLGV